MIGSAGETELELGLPTGETVDDGEWVLVIQGGIFVACVLLFRRGVIGEIANKLRIRL